MNRKFFRVDTGISRAVMWPITLLLSTASAATFADVDEARSGFLQHKKPPSFPSAYKAEYTYSIPYTATYLPQPLAYPVKLWVNDKKSLRRIDVYNGLDVEIDRDGKQYIQTPRLDKFICRLAGAEAAASPPRAPAHNTAGGTRRLLVGADANSRDDTNLAPKLPLLNTMHRRGAHQEGKKGPKPKLYGGLPTLDGFKFHSRLSFNNIKAEKWIYELKIEDTVGRYEYIISEKEGKPLRLHMMGSELALDSHFDEYVLDFLSFEELDADDEAPFALPDSCAQLDTKGTAARPVSLALAALVPGGQGRSEYDDFSDTHARRHADVSEYRKRRALFAHHDALIKAHNLGASAPYTLALNRFADWTDEEYRVLLGRKRRSSDRSAMQSRWGSSGRNMFEASAKFAPIPGTVDWRGSGAVGPVKDQGVCGSCWAFSTTQVLSAAWWRQTGEYVSFSEQQIMDCSWGYGENGACDGGDPDLAVKYVHDVGGVYKEADYPYKGADDYCKDSGSQVPNKQPTKMTPEVVYIKQYDSEAVREAVATQGPLSIGIDAACIPFRFYSKGVLDTSECGSSPDDIDHAVLLVGYGVQEGKPYWLVKNEWSAHWGDNGYIKISRDHDCAVATEAFFVDFKGMLR